MRNNSIFQYEQPRLPDNWNEQERRFFNRVIEIFDDIYSRFRNISMTQVIKQVLDTEIRTSGSATSFSVYSLAATFAKMTQLSAKVGTFDFETVQNLVSSALAAEQLSGGDVSINNLYVRYAQIGKAVLESVCVKCSEDGKYYTLEFHADGTTTATEAEVTQQEIDDGWTRNAQRIVALEVTAAELNAGSLKASEAIMDSITSGRIDVAQLFANVAFIELLRTARIVGDRSLEIFAEDFDNLSIGGRNLLLRENYSAEYVKGIGENSVSGYGFSRAGVSYETQIFGQIGTLSLSPGVDYTVSFTAWIESEDSDAMQALCVGLFPGALPQKSYSWDDGITPVPKRYTWTFNSSSTGVTNCSLRFFNDQETEHEEQPCYQLYPIYITDIQLETGNRATDWTPATEDINDAITDAQTAASNAQNTANRAAAAITETRQVVRVEADGLYLYPGKRDADTGEVEVDMSGYHQRFTDMSQRIQRTGSLRPDFATSPTVLILGNQAMFRPAVGGMGFRLATEDDYTALGV